MMVQNRSLHHTYLLPLVIYLLLMLDGFLLNVFAKQFLNDDYTLVPHLVLLGFVLFTFYFPKQPMQAVCDRIRLAF